MMTDVLTHISEGYGKIDTACSARREEVRRRITGHCPGAPLPKIDYSQEEDALWGAVISRLNAIHPAVACSRYLAATDRLALPVSRVPSLQAVSDQLRWHTGFQLLPAADLVPAKEFYSAFTDGYFHSTLYMRCPAVPLYSPDPDVLHELVGHAVMLTDPLFADLYRAFGEAVSLAASKDEVEKISKVFWYTMETGLVRESGGLRVYGAALLSSVGELESINKVDLEEFSIEQMLRQPYDIYQYQPMLFVVDSIDILAREVRGFLDDLRPDRF
jgi:phenylalanine-4-hydroxylase